MKRLIALLCLLFAPSAWATTTVTGSIKNLGTAAVTPGSFVRFWLRGCGGNQPRVNGTAVIGPTQGGVFYFDIAADASGNISGTIYSTRNNAGTGNGDIECGGSLIAVWYGMQIWVAGKAGPEVAIHAKSGATLDITQVTPITTNPVITSPTGDTTYARIDGGNQPFAGNVTPNGDKTISLGSAANRWNGVFGNVAQLNNLIYVDGSVYTTLAAAFAACPSTNCVIDMRGNSSALTIGTFDPGATFPVTLLLGPYTYSVAQITLRSGFHIYGTSSGVGVGGTPAATVLQSSSTTTPMFVLGGTTAVLGTHVEALRVYCGSGNASQIGFNIVAPNGGGHWWSDYKDIFVGGDGTHECAGGAILYDGNAGGAAGTAINQWIAFRDVRAFRATNGAPALKITGLNGQFSADNSEFDGPIPRDNNKVNILINDGTETFRSPYNFAFSNVTSQLAWGATGVAIQLAGVSDFTCLNCHFENDNGGIKATIGNTYGSWGTLIKNSQFDTGTGIDGGNGFILSTDANSSISFEDNSVSGTPDTMFAGASTKYVSSKGNINFTSGTLQPAPANNRPIGGFDGDSPALKHKRVTTGSVGAGTRINTTVTWTTAFPDANYTPVCTVIDSTTAPTAAGLVFERLNTIQTAASVTATIFNPTGGAITGQLDCIAIHD